MFGLLNEDLDCIKKEMSRFQEIEQAAVFGSRAMGNYKKGSDIDLVVYGERVTSEIITRLSSILNEESPLPYYFDIVHYETLKHSGLKEHIDNFSQTFYAR